MIPLRIWRTHSVCLQKSRTHDKRRSCFIPNTYHDDGYVCAKEDGTVIKPAYLSRKFKDIIEDADLPNIRLHDLRHSAATNLLNMGFTIKDVSVWLGHADITTTLNIYSHVLDESKSEMASALWSGKRAAS